MGKTLEQVKPLCDLTLSRLAKRKFREDPLLGASYSRMTSIAASAQRRHGHILEAALRCRLSAISHFEVWDDHLFSVSPVADNMVNAEKTPLNLTHASVLYGDTARTLQVDILVYDKNTKHISAYEVKRGGDRHDSGKTRSMFRDLLCLQVLLKSYGEAYGLEVKAASSRIIFYYGVGSIGAPWCLKRDDLNEHFGEDVVTEVEEVNSYLRQNLTQIMEAG